jgi:hypothetical protein
MKTYIASVIMLSSDCSLPRLSPLMERSLATLQSLTLSNYSKVKTFGRTLKSYANCLAFDLATLDVPLPKSLLPHISDDVNWQWKLWPEFILAVAANPNANVVVVSAGKKNQSLHDNIFRVAYSTSVTSKRIGGRTCSKPSSSSSSSRDSGIGMTTSFSSVNFFGGSKSSSFGSVDCESKVTSGGFYLGDDSEDPQTEATLALGEVDRSRLFSNTFNTPPPPPIHVPIDLGGTTTTDLRSRATTPQIMVSPSRFNPFHPLQLLPVSSYDVVHTLTEQIIEVNTDRNTMKTFNIVTEGESCLLRDQLNALLAKTRQLAELCRDPDKVNLFFTFNLEQTICSVNKFSRESDEDEESSS